MLPESREYTYDVKCLKKAAIEAHLIEAPLPLEHWEAEAMVLNMLNKTIISLFKLLAFLTIVLFPKLKNAGEEETSSDFGRKNLFKNS
jgi:hypothetical protein